MVESGLKIYLYDEFEERHVASLSMRGWMGGSRGGVVSKFEGRLIGADYPCRVPILVHRSRTFLSLDWAPNLAPITCTW